MRIVKNALGSIAAASLLVSQPLLAATPVSRTVSPTSSEEKLAGGASVFAILGAFVALLLIGEVTGAFHIFGDDSPKSP